MLNTPVAQYGKSTGYGLSAVGGELFYDTDNNCTLFFSQVNCCNERT